MLGMLMRRPMPRNAPEERKPQKYLYLSEEGQKGEQGEGGEQGKLDSCCWFFRRCGQIESR